MLRVFYKEHGNAISEGRRIKVDGQWIYPCHRNLIEGEGDDCTYFSGIYSYGFKSDGPTLWLYPHAEKGMNEMMRQGLASLIGVHRITGNTPVRSNSDRHIIFRLNEVHHLGVAA